VIPLEFTKRRTPKVNHVKYDNLRGCDLSVAPSLVARNRSPYCPNMIGDAGGNPVKRYGFRTIRSFADTVHSTWWANMNGRDYLYIHYGNQLAFYDPSDASLTVFANNVPNQRGTGFYFRHQGTDRFFFIAPGFYRYRDTGAPVDALQNAYIPTILISRLPSGGGTLFEPVNLLSAKRTESFLGNETDTVYQLSANNLDSSTVVVQEITASGWVTLTSGYTVNAAAGQVTFSAPHIPLVAGQDNIRITYSKTVPGYADRITNCTINTTFGVGGNNRVFLSGNPSYKAYDWWSELNDPTYFPDINYSIVGSGNTAIMGYQKLGEYLGIVKEENEQDSTIFLRIGALTDSGEAVFTLRTGTVGAGAISKRGFVNLNDEPLFLAWNGVFSTTYAYLSYDRATKNRSFLINKALEGKDLSDACACEFLSYYVLAVGSRLYLLDSRHKTGSREGNDWGYECYYWENINAKHIVAYEDNLYIVDENNKLKKYCNDTLAHNDDGAAIVAAWATPNDDDGTAAFFKTMIKKGCLVTVNPLTKMSVKIIYHADGNPNTFNAVYDTLSAGDLFNWSMLDWERWIWNGLPGPRDVYCRKKAKKYKRLQIVIVNDEVDEGLSIHSIEKLYTMGGYSKNRRF
jgi:hypothetical protein